MIRLEDFRPGNCSGCGKYYKWINPLNGLCDECGTLGCVIYPAGYPALSDAPEAATREGAD